MSDIQIPQRNPQYVAPVAPPTDLINGYLNRQQQYAQAVPNALNQLLENYYARQKLKAGAFESGGPYLMNMLYGNGQQPSQTPQPQVGGSTPSNGPATPTGSAQTLQPSAGQPDASGGIPETIQASLKMGHPDLTGLYSQAGQYQQMGKYGREQIQNLGSMAQLASAPQAAAQKDLEMRKTAGDLAMQPTEYAIKQQTLANAQQQIPMEIKKTVAGEVSKQSQDTQNITQLKTLASNLESALKGHDSGILGNLSGDIYQASGGRVGSASAAGIQNAANPLATALNTELARRFNSGEVALLSRSLIPAPKDTPEFAATKLANLNRLIDSMASGNEANVKNVANAITSGAIPRVGLSTTKHSEDNAPKNNQGPHGATVTQNGHIYSWNAKKGKYE